MIKKLLFTLVFVSVSIGFANADIGYVGDLQTLNLTDTTVLSQGNFLSEYGGLSFDMFTFGTDNYFFWPSDDYMQYGLFYTKFCWDNNGYRCMEGFNNYFYVCDSFTPDNYTTHGFNCTPQSDENLLINILNGVDSSQYRYYIHSDGGAFGRLCVSSNVGNSVCLSQEPYGNYPASNGLDLGNIPNVSSSYIGISPAGVSGGGNSIISGGQSPISGGYAYMNCTNQNVLAYYIRTFGYNGSMCNIVSGGVADGYYPYGTLLEFCNIIYIFNNEDLSYFNKPYTGHNKNIVCNSPGAYFTGDEPYSIDWSDEFTGVINGSGEYEVQSSDSFLINLTNVLKGNFYLPESGDFGLGYLPRYIILGFMGVIFFNFIRK